jgi:diguanylate cyclase (GGDEF)-like protein
LADRSAFIRHRPDNPPRTGCIAVYLIDIDRFAAVNEVWGRPLGDAVLQVYAQRLAEWLGGRGFLARVERDVFAVALDWVADAGAAISQARALQQQLAAIARIGPHLISREATIGVAVGEPGAARADLLADAEDALRVAQADGGGNVRLFRPPFRDALVAGARLDLDLSTAVRLGQLRLEYQPEVDLKTGELLATEALVRWQHPQLGRLAPDAFILAAEQTNVIGDVDEWVLRRACRQRAEWNERFDPSAPDGGLHVMRVNVSPRSFSEAPRERADLIAAIVAEAGLAPQQVCLELTEHAVPADTTDLADACTRLRAGGFAIALDDFGTGFSSIPHLKSVPADVLKIDRSFVEGVTAADGGDAAIVSAFVGLARAFGLQVVAEGVQTAEQAGLLVALGCRRGQGHLIGEAGPPSDLDPMLSAGGRALPQAGLTVRGS